MHWFDGDGLAHLVQFENGKVIYRNRFIKTRDLGQDIDAGQRVTAGLGAVMTPVGWLYIIKDMLWDKLFLHTKKAEKYTNSRGIDDRKDLNGYLLADSGRANTNFISHAGSFMFLYEGRPPTCVSLPYLKTVGVQTYYSKLGPTFSAHPKIDSLDGSMYSLGYSLKNKPFLTFYKIDSQGKLASRFPITLSSPRMIHEVLITENYVIVFDLPFQYDITRLVSDSNPLHFDPKAQCRIGLIPKDSTDETHIKWVNIDKPFYLFHGVNAWESVTGETLTIYGTADPNGVDFKFQPKTNSFEFRNLVGETFSPSLHRWTIQMTSQKIIESKDVSHPEHRITEFPRVNDSYIGKFSKHFYHVKFDTVDGLVHITGVLKCTLSSQDQKSDIDTKFISFDGKLGGECQFVPAKDPKSEDDGFLITFLYDPITNRSELVGYNALTFSSRPVFSFPLPRRVPFGFHGSWVDAQDYKSDPYILDTEHDEHLSEPDAI